MNAREMNALLTYAAANYDPRLNQSAEDRAVRATTWAERLEGVSVEAAQAAIDEHYATERRVLMLADLVEACEEPLHNSSWAGNVTEQRLAAEAAGLVPPLAEIEAAEEDEDDDRR